jgi:hypothetical protein
VLLLELVMSGLNSRIMPGADVEARALKDLFEVPILRVEGFFEGKHN